jgi:hypothetical protein
MLDSTTASPSLPNLLDILLANHGAILLLRDAEFLEQRADAEERAEKCIALHAQLQVAAVGGFFRNFKTGQREDANLLVDDLLARPERQLFPGLLALLIGLPDQRAAFGHAVEGISVREGLGVATENHRHVAQIAVDADAVLGGDHEVRGRRALLLGAVLGIGADVDDFLGIAEGVVLSVTLIDQIVEVAQDGAQVFAGGDGAPAADGVEAHGDRALGQQRRSFVADDCVRVVDAEDKEAHAVGGVLAVFAGAVGGGEFIRANDVLGAKVARAEAVTAAVDLRDFGERNCGQAGDRLNSLGKRGANVAAQRIVAGEGLIRALQDDDVLLALERGHDGGFREGANHVDVDGADAGVARLAQVIDSGLDVFSGRAEGDEDCFGVVRFVFADEAVAAAGQFGKFFIGVFEELENRLGEVVAPRHDAIHVVFLILHRAKQDGIGQVHHLGHAAARGAKQCALRLGGAVDDVGRRTEVLADQPDSCL